MGSTSKVTRKTTTNNLIPWNEMNDCFAKKVSWFSWTLSLFCKLKIMRPSGVKLKIWKSLQSWWREVGEKATASAGLFVLSVLILWMSPFVLEYLIQRTFYFCKPHVFTNSWNSCEMFWGTYMHCLLFMLRLFLTHTTPVCSTISWRKINNAASPVLSPRKMHGAYNTGRMLGQSLRRKTAPVTKQEAGSSGLLLRQL